MQRKTKTLTHIAAVNDDQVAFGAKLGLDLRRCTVSVAEARIEDAIDLGFRSIEDLGNPTHKQVELAVRFGYDISRLSRREGGAVINDLMTQLNLETIEAEGLAPGVAVINIHDSFEQQYVISSIRSDATVYLRGGNGKRAWARSLRRAANAKPGAAADGLRRPLIGRTSPSHNTRLPRTHTYEEQPTSTP